MDYNFFREKINKIFKAQEENLKVAINLLEDKKNSFSIDQPEYFIFFSKEVPIIILAHIYMYQGDYSNALVLLKEVEKKGYYEISADLEISNLGDKKLIFGLINNMTSTVSSHSTTLVNPILTYTDVILSLAECEMNLSNESAAQNYLYQVNGIKNIVDLNGYILESIKEVRAMLFDLYYFTYLKRTGLAQSVIGLEDYQLLLPIPVGEFSQNKNQGY